MKNSLNIMIGLPGSGKTTYCKDKLLNDDSIYLSSDDLRVELYGYEDQTHNNEVFIELNKRCKEALKNGKNVVYDATNINKKRRMQLTNDMKRYYGELNYYFFTCNISEIFDRNAKRLERKIPWEKLNQMIISIDVPLYYEGYDNLYIINNSSHDEYHYGKLISEYLTYDQGNPHHNESLGNHILTVIEKCEEYENDCDNKNILVRAARWHDLGKVYTRNFNNEKGYYTYYNHNKVSAYMFLCYIAFQRANTKRLMNSDEKVCALIYHHMDWYMEQSMERIKNLFNNDNLFYLLILLHEADKYRV